VVAWNAPRVKVQLQLAIQRLKTLQEKKESVAKAARRDIATLLERAKVETARIKTESIINEDIYVELLELMELYSEIVFTRFGLIENNNAREPDPGVSEAIIGIVYAAHRTEVKELHYIRESFMHRYGRDWSIAVMENVGNRVSGRVLSKVTNETPSAALVDAYLTEIARGYSVSWSPPEPPIMLQPSPASPDVFESSEVNLDPMYPATSPTLAPEKRKDEPSEGFGEETPSISKASYTGPSVGLSKATSRRCAPSPKPISPPESSSPPAYLETFSKGAKDDKDNAAADDDDDNDDDLLRRFQALSNRK